MYCERRCTMHWISLAVGISLFTVPAFCADRLVSGPEIIRIRDKIQSFTEDGLGVAEFQAYVDGLQYGTPQEIGLDDARTIANSISDKLRIRERHLRELRDTIEDRYADVRHNDDAFSTCRSIELQERSFLHNTELNRDTWCIAGTSLDNDLEKDFLPDAVLAKMKEIVERDRASIKSVYYGSEQGVLTKYPASRLCSSAGCDEDYDPRFQSWYVTAASPQPKDIVIVVDQSGSMSSTINGQETLMDIARNAAITVLKTLNLNDRVGLVTFNEEASTPSGEGAASHCYSSMLSKATPINVAYLIKHVKNIRPDGSTRYSNALQRAFQLFVNTEADVNDHRVRDKVILMLSDGDPTDDADDIYSALRAGNAALHNEVVILTYGIGELGQTGQTILENLAMQVSANTSYGEVTRGRFELVTSPDNLRLEMGSYYNFFRLSGSDPQVQYTVPYRDDFNTGLQISMCLQVIHRNALKGVTCIVQPLEDIVSEITYYRKGDLSYGFITDAQMRVMTHPLLANPSDVSYDVSFIHISTLEAGGSIDRLFEKMARGENGSMTITSKRVIARGDVQTEGVSSKSVLSDYFFYPIAYTDFSLCIVNARGATLSLVSSSNWQTPDGYPDFLYHKALDPTEERQIGKASTSVALCNSGAVKLAARAFTNQLEYLVKNETANDLIRYKRYFTGQSEDTLFKPTVREIVAVTNRLNTIFKSRTAYQDSVIWRYFGADLGVIIMYPGIELPKLFDPTIRTWYKRALASPSKVTLTTPYVDAGGAGTVLSIAKAIYDGSTAGSRRADSLVMGVMSIDLSFTFTYYVITDGIEACANYDCFVLDQAGFIVVHKDWLETQAAVVSNVHMTSYEEKIAARLGEENIWRHSSCINIENVREQQFGKIVLAGSHVEDWFEIHEISGTNIFLVVKKSISLEPLSCDCPVPRGSPFGVYRCSSSFECSCPCYQSTNLYSYCPGVYTLRSDDPPPCTPPIPSIDWGDIAIRDAALIPNLEPCHNYRCQEKLTELDCAMTLTCRWCVAARDECDVSPVPSCHTDSHCTAQQAATFDPSRCRTTARPKSGSGNGDKEKDSPESGSSFPVWAIAIVAAAAVLVVAVVVMALCLWRCYRKKSQSPVRRADEDPYARIPSIALAQSIELPSKASGKTKTSLYQRRHQMNNKYAPDPMRRGNSVDNGTYLSQIQAGAACAVAPGAPQGYAMPPPSHEGGVPNASTKKKHIDRVSYEVPVSSLSRPSDETTKETDM